MALVVKGSTFELHMKAEGKDKKFDYDLTALELTLTATDNVISKGTVALLNNGN
jgi:hypothetical protein